MAVQTGWLGKDYDRALGVADTPSDKEIQRAYRKLARQFHPDANPNNPEAEERFTEISAAYDVLGDAEKRKEYDELRRLGPMAAGCGNGGADGVSGFRFTTDGNGSDLGDLFGDMFAGRARGPAGGRARTTAMRGRDLEAELHLDFTKAVYGLTTEVHVTSEVTCSTCGGSGAKPGTQPVTCPTCQGRGQVSETQGFFAIAQTCRRCRGRGQIVETPCEDCRGAGVQRKPRQVKVRIPAGVDDGQLIRPPGRGEPGRDGGPPGDLFVLVRVAPHALFGRDGPNLTLRLPVTYPEAVLGAEVKVPTLDGAPVTVRIPPGTRSGRVLRVRGHGVPRARGGRGDLLVTVEVDVPSSVDAKERKAVEALAKALSGNPRAHLGV
jgi:molecular chaperone DnaJ